MKLRPREDQAFLATREVACSSLNWIQYVDADMVLIVGVEVGRLWGPPASTNIRMTIPKNREISGIGSADVSDSSLT